MRESPSRRRGRLIAAPSGKFCRPMPSASARAEAVVTAPPGTLSAEAARAHARPTAMPSGILCSVTASTKSVVRFSGVCGPSGSFEPGCRCGITASSARRNTAPSRKPPAAGTQPGSPPASSAISMAGIKRLHTLAATITPAAKPRNTR